MSLGKKLIKGAVWNALSRFGAQGINFVALVLLTRLLNPKDFGLIAMAMVFVTILGYFSECGLKAALIQAKEVDDGDCQTVFWSTLFFSVSIYAVLFFCAAWIAFFYHESRVIWIVRSLSVMLLFAPLGYIPEVQEIKTLRYDRIAIADLIGSGVSGGAAVVLAFLGCGFWSLVFQQVVMILVRSVTLMFFTGWRPRRYFSYRKFKSLYSSGIHFTVKNVILYCSNNVDAVLVGRLLGPAALGIYGLSMRLASYATVKVWTIFGDMLMPAFVSIRDEMERLKKNFAKITGAGVLLLTPLLVALFFGVDSLVSLLFGNPWLETVPIIRILILFFLVDSILLPDESILMALDKIRTINIVKTAVALMLLAGGWIALKSAGLAGMAVVFTAVSIVAGLVIKNFLLKLLHIRVHHFLSSIKKVFAVVLAAGVLLGLYALCFRQVRSNLFFLSGEAVILVGFFMIILWKYRLIDFNEKKINIDKLLADPS